jgi:hypothetical protein
VRATAAAGFTMVVGGTVYLMFLIVTAANVIGPVLFAQPIPWLALRGLAILTVLSATVSAWTLWRLRSRTSAVHQVRIGMVLGTTILFLPWAVYWGLL